MQHTEDVHDHAAPAGFRLVPKVRLGAFLGRSIDYYMRAEAGHLTGGFRVQPGHLNPGGTCHGGMIATFCDIVMPFSAIYELRLGGTMLPTISLSTTFLAPAPAGSWVESTGEILKATRNMVFAQALIRADGKPVARTDTVLKIIRPAEGSAETEDWMRALLEQPDA